MNSRTHFCFKRIHIFNDSVAADVSVITAAAYSTLGVTTAARAEAVAADDTVTTATSANLSTAEAVAADDSFETAASKTDEEEKVTSDVAEGNIQNKGVKGVSVLG